LLAVAVAAAGWLLSAPKQVSADRFSDLTGDAAMGEAIFYQSGCASCHRAEGASDVGPPVLAGGKAFPSPFGTFYAPNISPSDAGIADWSIVDLANSLRHGTSPEGQHYYPAFPYGSYAGIGDQEIADLAAYLAALPADATPSRAHDVGFPFNIRRGLGLWKRAFLRQGPYLPDDGLSSAARQGRALVEGRGHCGECHTPRGLFGNLDYGKWLHGAPNPTGPGRIPALAGIQWSAADIAAYLQSGFTPEFDTAGGEMVEVIKNTARLSDEDRSAIAAYIKALPMP